MNRRINRHNEFTNLAKRYKPLMIASATTPPTVGAESLNKILLIPSGTGTVGVYNKDATGLAAAIAAASSGDTISVPSGSISLTSGITVPSGVYLRGQGYANTTLSFSGIATAVTLSSDARLGFITVTISGTGTDVTAVDATTNDAFIEYSFIQASGGSSTNTAALIGSSGSFAQNPEVFYSVLTATGTSAVGAKMPSSGVAKLHWSILYGDTYSIDSSGGTSAHIIGNHYGLDTTNGTIVYRDGDRVADIGARAYNTSSQSVNHATATALTFNSETYDSDSMHSTSTNTSRMTCNSPGIYTMTGSIEYASNSTGLRYAQIKVNNTTIKSVVRTAMASGNHQMEVSVTYPLVKNDYVELFAYQTSGGALNVNAGGVYTPSFEVQRIG